MSGSISNAPGLSATSYSTSDMHDDTNSSSFIPTTDDMDVDGALFGEDSEDMSNVKFDADLFGDSDDGETDADAAIPMSYLNKELMDFADMNDNDAAGLSKLLNKTEQHGSVATAARSQSAATTSSSANLEASDDFNFVPMDSSMRSLDENMPSSRTTHQQRYEAAWAKLKAEDLAEKQALLADRMAEIDRISNLTAYQRTNMRNAAYEHTMVPFEKSKAAARMPKPHWLLTTKERTEKERMERQRKERQEAAAQQKAKAEAEANVKTESQVPQCGKAEQEMLELAKLEQETAPHPARVIDENYDDGDESDEDEDDDEQFDRMLTKEVQRQAALYAEEQAAEQAARLKALSRGTVVCIDNDPDDPVVAEICKDLFPEEVTKLTAFLQKNQKAGKGGVTTAKLIDLVDLMLKGRNKKAKGGAANGETSAESLKKVVHKQKAPKLRKPANSARTAASPLSAPPMTAAPTYPEAPVVATGLSGMISPLSCESTSSATTFPRSDPRMNISGSSSPARVTSPAPAETASADYSSLLYDETRKLLSKRGLKAVNSKPKMIQRLQQYDAAIKKGETPPNLNQKGVAAFAAKAAKTQAGGVEKQASETVAPMEKQLSGTVAATKRQTSGTVAPVEKQLSGTVAPMGGKRKRTWEEEINDLPGTKKLKSDEYLDENLQLKKRPAAPMSETNEAMKQPAAPMSLNKAAANGVLRGPGNMQDIIEATKPTPAPKSLKKKRVHDENEGVEVAMPSTKRKRGADENEGAETKGPPKKRVLPNFQKKQKKTPVEAKEVDDGQKMNMVAPPISEEATVYVDDITKSLAAPPISNKKGSKFTNKKALKVFKDKVPPQVVNTAAPVTNTAAAVIDMATPAINTTASPVCDAPTPPASFGDAARNAMKKAQGLTKGNPQISTQTTSKSKKRARDDDDNDDVEFVSEGPAAKKVRHT